MKTNFTLRKQSAFVNIEVIPSHSHINVPLNKTPTSVIHTFCIPTHLIKHTEHFITFQLNTN